MAATILIKTAKECEKLLKAVGATYHFKLPTGEEYTNEVKEPEYTGPKTTRGTKPKRKTMAKGYPYGFRLQYVREKMGELEVGDVEQIPMHDAFDNLEDLRKTVASAAVLKWGKDAHRTAMNKEAKVVEVLRAA